MNWLSEYKKKLVSIEEAASVVKSNNRIYIGGNASTPYEILEALARRKDELYNVEVVHVLVVGEKLLSGPEMEGHFRHNSFFAGPADREAINEGCGDYVPIFVHEIPRLFYSKAMEIDVAILQLSLPDNHGFMSFGAECLISKSAAECAKIVVAEVNEKMPRTLGNCFIHISQVNKIVEVSRDLPELKTPPLTDVEKAIGKYIEELIEEGSTLQLGIGGIATAVLKAVEGKKDLGIHTEMVSDSMMEAIEAGIITGAKKTLHPHKVVATFLFGSKKLYEFAHNNPIFEIHPVEYVNDPFIISKNDKMIAINSAIEVDLTGQVCSDSIGTKIYSGFGGQVDFIRGAARSKGGKPIIALTSTTEKGEISRIVPYLKQGAGVVTTRADIHYVCTEYGVAYLHGKNLKQRAESLIAIAHPKFRKELEIEAKKRKLL